MSNKIIDLQFPVGGVHRRAGYQKQPPYTTPDARNVRPYDTLKARLRGGSRPGLIKSHYTQLGSGNPTRLLDAVTVVVNNGLTFWTDNFDQPALSSVWTTSSWLGAGMTIFPDNPDSVTASNAAGGVSRAALSDLDVAQDYVVEMFIVPWMGQHWGTYQISLRMDNSAPAVTTAGVLIELAMQDASGTFSGNLKYYTGSVLTTNVLFTSGATGNPQAGWLRVFVSGNDITVTWLDNTVLAATTVGAPAGARVGFGAHATQVGTAPVVAACLIDTFRMEYKTSNNNQAYRRLLVSSSNGSLYKENYLNTMVAVSSARTLASDRMLMSAERYQKLYIADNYFPRITGTTTGSLINGTTFDSAAVADWSVYGISAEDDVVVLTNPTGGVVAGTYEISAIAAGSITLASSAATSVGNADFRIERCPKIYDPAANTMTRYVATTALGSVPSGCPLVCCYRDRIVFAGPPVAPHAWFMSRAGNPLDFNYGASSADAGRAVAGTNTEAGLLGEPIRALIHGGDDYLIFGCENSMWKLSGDPTYGGQLNSLSRTIGCVDKKAWCYGPSHEIIFLSRDGLYVMPPGGGNPASISRERLPDDLLRLDNNLFDVQLQFDVQDRGIHIFVTPKTASGALHWWFDWETKSFWPWSVATTYDATASLYFAASCASDTAVILGCRDGYIRRFFPHQETDEATAFTSYCQLGPVKLGSDYHEGILTELIGSLAQHSGPVAWYVYTGQLGEDAAGSTTAKESGSWSLSGLNYKARPRTRGGSFVLKLQNYTAGRRWAIERVTAVLLKAGKQRV